LPPMAGAASFGVDEFLEHHVWLRFCRPASISDAKKIVGTQTIARRVEIGRRSVSCGDGGEGRRAGERFGDGCGPPMGTARTEVKWRR